MYYNQEHQFYNGEDRQFFVPFLLGGLAGSAIVGLSRPRPVYVNSPYPPRPYPPYPPYPPYRPYGAGYYNYQSSAFY